MVYPANKSSIINRNGPVLIIDDSNTIDVLVIMNKLRSKGLVSRVIHQKDVVTLDVSSKYALITVVIGPKADNNNIVERLSERSPHIRKLVIHIDPSPSLRDVYRRFNIDYIESDSKSENISDEIAEYFKRYVHPSQYNKTAPKTDYTSLMNDLVDRLELATDAIADLRLNSTSEIIGELRYISGSIRSKFNSGTHKSLITRSDVRNTAIEALVVLSKLYDQIENSRLAAIIVSGATTALMGCSGYSAVLSVTIMLASWNGKEAFLAAINNIRLSKESNKT